MKHAVKHSHCMGIGGRDGAGALSPCLCAMPQPRATRERAR